MLEGISIVTGLAGRYATSLYELARDSGSLVRVEEDLQSLKRAIDSSADLKRLIRSPVIARADQWKALDALVQRMGLADLTRRFLGVVTKNHRLFVLPVMIEDFFKLTAQARDELTANVTSAQPLSNHQLENLKSAIKSALGRSVTIIQSLDPELLGGLVVRVGSIMIDSSLRTQLSKLQVAMREVN